MTHPFTVLDSVQLVTLIAVGTWLGQIGALVMWWLLLDRLVP